MTLEETFEQAVAESKTFAQKPDNDTLLKIYSLYKQATAGDAPEKGAYSMFDFVGKAKHEAWKNLQSLSADEAKTQYIALIQLLKE